MDLMKWLTFFIFGLMLAIATVRPEAAADFTALSAPLEV